MKLSIFTKVELTVDLLTVDDVEAIGGVPLHVTDFKVEPLTEAIGPHIWGQNEVIFVLTDLPNDVINNTLQIAQMYRHWIHKITA